MNISKIIILFLCSITFSFAQKNVVLIIADDLGLEYCGFYGNTGDTVIMPNVQSLLSKGIRFTN
ncbi:MAG: arylsulfatase, partial [Candidatus Kapaibacteriota bacterium]